MDPGARAEWERARPGKAHPVDAACVAPWVSLEFDPQGWVYTCCANQQYPLGRIGVDRLRDLWAGERAMVLREAQERWDLSVGCGSCRWHLEHGRMDPDAAVYDRYELTGHDPPGPASMTFALSNRCNLGCVMCNGELSSTLRHQAGQSPLPMRYDDEFFDDLAGFLPGLQYAKFLGGEPFLIPEHDRVWQLMDEGGGPDRLQVTTNATVWTERVEWLLERFRVDVTLSIDAVTPELYEDIRGGASHPAVMQNVERFREACAEADTELRLCFCLMTLNWQELPAYLRWADELGSPVSVNVVSDVGLALHDLPTSDLEEVARAWDAADGASGLNEEVWQTQRVQLEAVLADRRRGIPPAPRQAQAAPEGLLDGPPPSVAEASVDAGSEAGRLRAWSTTGMVTRVEVDADGTIAAVASEAARLGLDETLVGEPVSRLVAGLTAADGRSAWLLGSEQVGACLVRTVVLAEDRPQRGTAGTIVRTVAFVDDGTWTILIAEDRTYDRGAGIEVHLRQSS